MGATPRLQRGVGGFEFVTHSFKRLLFKFDLNPEFCLVLAGKDFP